MIEVAHLVRRYGAVLAVDDLSLELAKGEVVGFLGPNGAGKTTTMRILAGYLPATRAQRLVVAGHDVLRDSLEVRRRIGYLPESVPLYREMRVEEMMRFQGKLHRMDKLELRDRVPEVLDRVGVLDRRKQLVGNLSRGLRQRVGLAVALLPNPEVLILDEPTSGLDPIQRREVRSLISELAEEHTVLLSSHILAEVEAICPRVAIIHEGRLLADGTLPELQRRFAGAGYVRLEAALPDAEEAARLLRSLPGVERVEVGARVGMHTSFGIYGEGDLREDAGALAMTRGWALRELSFVQPSLEELFARLVLGEAELVEGAAGPAAAPAQAPAAAPAAAPAQPSGGISLDLMQPGAAPAPQKKVIYSLNPFDQGASRDLSKPMEVDAPPPADGDEGGGS